MTHDATALAEICRRWRILRVRVFGSVARGGERAGSDIDLLVEFERGHAPSLIAWERLRDELSVVFDGREVDLATPVSLSPHIRDRVLAEARLAYAA